jgi:uncharacterized protein (DUF4415 family)
MSKSKIIRYEIDLDNPPRLTEEQKTRLKALAEKQDSEIDCGDIPELDEKFWQNAVRNPFYRPTKKSTTVRIDSDVLAWYKRQGKGYQTKINATLRKAMIQSFSESEKSR